mmetsp:Transcript_14746/g.25180  ORF Transcript_14746/g.25180 Transcript_14746/m.25180 type:complete len:237 (+) Transcript_14746:714-1424(+)
MCVANKKIRTGRSGFPYLMDRRLWNNLSTYEIWHSDMPPRPETSLRNMPRTRIRSFCTWHFRMCTNCAHRDLRNVNGQANTLAARRVDLPPILPMPWRRWIGFSERCWTPSRMPASRMIPSSSSRATTDPGRPSGAVPAPRVNSRDGGCKKMSSRIARRALPSTSMLLRGRIHDGASILELHMRWRACIAARIVGWDRRGRRMFVCRRLLDGREAMYRWEKCRMRWFRPWMCFQQS